MSGEGAGDPWAMYIDMAERHGDLRLRHHRLCVALMVAISNGEPAQTLLDLIGQDLEASDADS